MARGEFKLFGGFLIHAVGELEGVGEVEFFEEPGGANAAGGLEEVESYLRLWHGGRLYQYVKHDTVLGYQICNNNNISYIP